MTGSLSNDEVLDAYFASQMEENKSPFLTKKARKWGSFTVFKTSLIATICFVTSFLPKICSHPICTPISYLSLLVIFFILGIPSIIESLEKFANKEVDIDFLMMLGAFACVFLNRATEGALLLILFAISGALESFSMDKAQSSLFSLRKLACEYTFVCDKDGIPKQVPLWKIKLNDEIYIKAGEVVPLDGLVIKGSSFLNTVHLTGESIPKRIQEGSFVPSGAYNLDGVIVVKVTATGQDSTLSKLISMIIAAKEAKPKLENFFQTFLQKYTIFILAIAVSFTLFAHFILGDPLFAVKGALYKALTFIIAASPCSVIISVPIAYLSGLSLCSKRGAVVKGSYIFDQIRRCSVIAVDKTGTLTGGKPEVSDAILFGLTMEQACTAAFSLEKTSSHPIASAILDFSIDKKKSELSLVDILNKPGFGVSASCDDNKYYIGQPDWVFSSINNQYSLEAQESIKKYILEGCSCAVLGSNLGYAIFIVVDQMRYKVAEIIQLFKSKHNLRVIMLTGDTNDSATKAAAAVGITEIYSDLKPEDKLAIVTKLQDKDNLIMIGDGINDAPSLAKAHVGIAMGKIGSASATNAADIVLLNDDLLVIENILSTSKKMNRIIKQNLFFGFSIMIGAGLVSLLGLLLLWPVVILHEGSTVITSLNSLRLLRNKHKSINDHI